MSERYLKMEFTIEGVEVYHDGDWKNFENPYKITVVFGELYNQEEYREKPFNFEKWKKQVWSWVKKGVPSVDESTVDGFCIWLKDRFSEKLKESERFLYSLHVEDSKGNKITYTK